MSGGSMEYCFRHIRDAADFVNDKEVKELMYDLAGLLHDLEWYDSGDYSEEAYLKTLNVFKKKWFGGDRNERLKEYINSALDDVKEEVNNLIG